MSITIHPDLFSICREQVRDENLTSFQLSYSQMVQGFKNEASNPLTLLSLVVGGAVARSAELSCFKIFSSFSCFSKSHLSFLPLRLPSLLGIVAEGGMFAGIPIIKEGEPFSALRVGAVHGSLVIGLSRLLGKFTHSNVILNCLAQDGIVIGIDLSFESVGLREKENKEFVERWVHARGVGFQMHVSSQICHQIPFVLNHQAIFAVQKEINSSFISSNLFRRFSSYSLTDSGVFLGKQLVPVKGEFFSESYLELESKEAEQLKKSQIFQMSEQSGNFGEGQPPLVEEGRAEDLKTVEPDLVNTEQKTNELNQSVQPKESLINPTNFDTYSHSLSDRDFLIRGVSKPNIAGIKDDLREEKGELISRTWRTEPSEPRILRYGAASHKGFKLGDNQDFTFAVEVKDREGKKWVLHGVADGVTDWPWQILGAQRNSEAFIEVMQEILEETEYFELQIKELQFQMIFSEKFTEKLLTKLTTDERDIVEKQRGCVDDDFACRYFFGKEGAENRRRKFFRSTLVASAMSQAGGFLLKLGDGMAQVKRYRRGVLISSTRKDPLTGTGPADAIGLDLIASRVQEGIIPIELEGAEEIELRMTTDGAQDANEKKALESLLNDHASTEKLVESLVEDSRPQVYWHQDNISVAFSRIKMGRFEGKRQVAPFLEVIAPASQEIIDTQIESLRNTLIKGEQNAANDNANSLSLEELTAKHLQDSQLVREVLDFSEKEPRFGEVVRQDLLDENAIGGFGSVTKRIYISSLLELSRDAKIDIDHLMYMMNAMPEPEVALMFLDYIALLKVCYQKDFFKAKGLIIQGGKSPDLEIRAELEKFRLDLFCLASQNFNQACQFVKEIFTGDIGKRRAGLTNMLDKESVAIQQEKLNRLLHK